MTFREGIVAALLTLTVGLTLFCSLGLVVMRTPYERLHFVTPPASLGAAFLTLAILIDGQSLAASSKAVVMAVLLLVSNGVVSHVTARAARIRELGGWVLGDTLPPETTAPPEQEDPS